MFKVGHVFTLKKHKATSINSPFGFGKAETYSYFQIYKDYSYFVEYNKDGYENDYLSIYFLED